MSKTGHQFDSTILREYDIRGIVGTTLHAADAGAIGRAFGTLVRRNGGKKVALGYDGRLSSPDIDTKKEGDMAGVKAGSLRDQIVNLPSHPDFLRSYCSAEAP